MDPVCCCVCCLLLAVVLGFVAVGSAFAAGDDGVRTGSAVGSGAASRLHAPPEEVLQSFALLNQLRAEGFTCPGGHKFEPNGVPLQFDCALFRAAQMHSEDMAKNDFLSNYSPGGLSPMDRATAQGSPATGENVARGQREAYQAIAAWQASEGPCRTMMDAGHKLVAVGLSSGGGAGGFLSSARGHSDYWTQMFADSSVPADQSCLPSDLHLYGHSTAADAHEPVVGKVGKTWQVGEAPPAEKISTTNPTGGFKFHTLGQ